jgi:hypothetical protein
MILVAGVDSVKRNISPVTFPTNSKDGNNTRSGMIVPLLMSATSASSIHLIFWDVVPSGWILMH